jgi:hypothetical protein
MNSWRQIHEDGSQSVIYREGYSWHIDLIIVTPQNEKSRLVGLMTSDLDQAKALCRMAMEKENFHVCTEHCQDWEAV